MRNDLMAEKIEVDPMRIASSLAAAQKIAVKSAGRRQIMDGKSEMKTGTFGHGVPFAGKESPIAQQRKARCVRLRQNLRVC
jgi:hypothetical protein